MPATRSGLAGRASPFAPDGLIYITVGGAARLPDAQATNTIFGKVLRLKDDGTVPSDNPFVGKAGSRPEIYTVGHRDHHGIAPNPATGQIFHAGTRTTRRRQDQHPQGRRQLRLADLRIWARQRRLTDAAAGRGD